MFIELDSFCYVSLFFGNLKLYQQVLKEASQQNYCVRLSVDKNISMPPFMIEPLCYSENNCVSKDCQYLNVAQFKSGKII